MTELDEAADIRQSMTALRSAAMDDCGIDPIHFPERR